MIIQVAELPKEGLTFTDVTPFGSAFGDASWRLTGVDLSLLPDGADVVVHGHVDATVPLTCGRCLESFPSEVVANVELRLTPRSADRDTHELAEDDLDTDFYVGGELDLDRLIEAETTLALPMKPLCRDDCRGLCPACGGNRNQAACDCQTRPPDPRLAVLKQLTVRPGR